MQETEKECGICGKYFKTSNPKRKYCDDCSKNYTARKRDYESGLNASRRRMYEPRLKEITCEVCGRKIKATRTILMKTSAKDEDNVSHRFCCKAHKDQWKEEHAVCAWCGAPMLGTGRYNPNSSHPQYCSEECQEKAKWEQARKEGNVHTCLYCGKEFVRKGGGTFCNKACLDAARAGGWKPDPNPPGKVPVKERLITRNETCSQCGREYQRKYKGELPDPYPVFCSNECYQKFRKKMVARRRAKK